MTSAVTPHAPSAANIAAAAASRSDTTTSPQPGAVPAQPPARSYANATKTATPTSAAPAGASAQNAKSSDASVNGASTAQGGPQGASNTTNNGPVPNGAGADHGRKPSVVISASGTSGYTPNGGPVGQSARPPIQFGSTNQGSPLPQPSVPHQTQANLTPQQNPRVTSPAHSPSPIPQPQASGGRPPSSLQSHGNGPTFGSMAGEGSPANPMAQPNMGQVTPMHERRTSSQSAQGGNFGHNGGRGRPFPGQNYNAMASPGQAHRSLPNQQRPNVPAQFQQAPNSPFGRGGNRSPAPQMPPQPHMSQGHMGGNPQMQYAGYPQHMHPQQVCPQ
ncbi:MAG: hypothetical protein INR71_04045 [Terriglobus roseus]|nr:hypothetical protein [Terriglobus roseus]